MEDYLCIGTITNTHALKGELKVYSTTDFSEERYKKGNIVYIEKDQKLIEVTVESHRFHKNFDLIKFKGYNSINDVLQFKQCKLYVHKSQLSELDEDEFYYYELIGCRVYEDTKEIGIVENVVNYGASDIIIIKDSNNKEIMIPFVDEFLESVDTENKVIKVQLIEGLLGE